jgi:AcrR family transcriptional regulator
LFDTLVRERFSKISRLLSEAFTAGGTPLERLRRVLVYTLEVAQSDPEYRAILELTWYQSDIPEVQDGVKECHDAMWAFLDTLTGLVRAGIRRDEITSHVDPQTTAFAAVSYVNGITGMWLSSPESIDIKREAKTLIDLFLEGIAQTVSETA